jgi:hypothetical protein
MAFNISFNVGGMQVNAGVPMMQPQGDPQLWAWFSAVDRYACLRAWPDATALFRSP